jgi:hypothetical protein
LASEKEEGGNNEEHLVPAEVLAVEPTPVVKAAAGELPALGVQAVDVNVKAVGGGIKRCLLFPQNFRLWCLLQ